nr:hypothetical protein Iba_chr09dCG12230 [Ipomoea batatas]
MKCAHKGELIWLYSTAVHPKKRRERLNRKTLLHEARNEGSPRYNVLLRHIIEQFESAPYVPAFHIGIENMLEVSTHFRRAQAYAASSPSLSAYHVVELELAVRFGGIDEAMKRLLPWNGNEAEVPYKWGERKTVRFPN